jgi:hypothetical protein
MAPTVRSYGADLKIKDLLEFVDFHHSLMIFANSESRKTVRELANEFGVDFEDYGYTMQGGKAPERTSQPAFRRKNVTWSAELFEPLERVFTPLERPVLFEDGIGAVLDTNKNNSHVFPILRADPGGYSYNAGAPERRQTGGVSGNQLTLVAGYQTRYNQRVVLSGSTQMCSNEAMLANRDPAKGATVQSSPNYILCTEMVEWNLHERGILRVANVRHNKVGDKWDGHNPENYKRQVDIEYFIDIFERK